MPPLTDNLDLDRLGLASGGGTRFEISVRVGDFVFGKQNYTLADDPLPVVVDISRTTTGYVVRARLLAELEGPCMRCSDDLGLPLKIDQSDIHEPSLGDELASDYVEGTQYDIAAFVRDAIGLALPPSISGELDDEGGCTACDRTPLQIVGLGLDDDFVAEDEAAREPDPRWAKLRELEL